MSGMLTATEIFGGAAPEPTMPQPSSTPTLAAVLYDIRAYVRRYVVLSDEQAFVVTLWTAHTHVLDGFDCTPYLQITSATKRAGKTRLLEVLEPLVARPWFTGRMSAAVLVRKMDAEHPTLLLDESDAAFKSDKEYAEALRAILNSGYRRSGKASLCVGQGANITYKDFSTFGAKAIAGIGELPDTIADRAIRIELKRRRTTDEPCTRWRERDGQAEAAPIHEQLVAWAGRDRIIEALRTARPALPSGLGDRQADVWEPLFAIADLAGGEWPAAARRAAVALAGSIEDQDVVVELLTDIRMIVAETAETIIPSKDLIAKLLEREDRPWATWRHDKPMTPRALARLLGPLGIHPVHLARLNGYRRDAFDDAFARYLPFEPSLLHQPNKYGAEPAIMNLQTLALIEASKTVEQPDFHWGNEGMKDENGVTGDEDHAGDDI